MIEGLKLTENWLDADEQRHCEIAVSEALSLTRATSLKQDRSRVLRYGWDYTSPSRRLPHWPSWLEELRLRLPHIPSTATCAITLNEYAPDHRIGPHVDSKLFGEPIQIISLGAEAQMLFASHLGTSFVTLSPGSLLSMAGDARWCYTHQIEPVIDRRYSIVFRVLLTKTHADDDNKRA